MLWLAEVGEVSTGETRTVAALSWDGSSALDTDPLTIDLDLKGPNDTTQRILLEVRRELLEPGEIGVVLLSVAPDPVTLFGREEAALLAPGPEGVLVAGGQYVEISLLVSNDNGATYTDLDEERLRRHPIRLVMYDLLLNDVSMPAFHSHPTYVDSDPASGIQLLAEAGAWEIVSTMTLPQEPLADDGTQIVSMEGYVTSLSVFAPFDTGDAMFADLDTSDGDTDDTNSDDDTTDSTGGGGGGGGGGTGGDGTTDEDSLTDLFDLTAETQSGVGGSDVHVDFAYEGQELGTELKPFNTIAEGIEAVMAGGTVWIRPGVTYETFAGIDKPLLLQVWDDPARAPGDDVFIGDVFTCSGPDADSFSYPNFSSTAGLTVTGDAQVLGSIIELVPNTEADDRDQSGAVWTTEQKSVVRGFDVSFTAFFEDGTSPKDGIAFVVQNASATPATSPGGNMGYSIIDNCLAVEFDGSKNFETNDPPTDHTAVMRSNPGNNAVHDPSDGPPEGHQLDSSWILALEGRTVAGRIVYDAELNTLKVYDDGVEEISLTNFDIETYVTLDEGRAWMGLIATSADLFPTGRTDLLSWSAIIPDDEDCGVFTVTDLSTGLPVAMQEKVFISGTPSMPDLQAAFTGPPASTDVDMSLEVRYEIDELKSNGDVKFRADETFFPEPEGSFNSFGGAHTWNLLTSYGNTFTGGEATFHYRLDPAGPVGDFPIKIRGNNPDDADVISYIQSQDSFTYLPAMAREESFLFQAPSFFFNHFNPPVFGNDTVDSMPNWGGPDGWGIMQLDGVGLDRTILVPELWNWHASVEGGVAVLNTKRTELTAYVNAVQTEYPAEYEDPFAPGAYTHEVTVNSTPYTLSFEEASLIQRYNGGRAIITFGTPPGPPHAYAWEFDPSKPAGSRWIFGTNSKNYVFKVMEHFDALQNN